jgi:hypothetical protein
MDYLGYIFTFILGLGAGWTLKIVISNHFSKHSKTSFISQKANHAGGDIVAGDKNKNNHE